MADKPAFTITLAHGRTISIWANGHVEGVLGTYKTSNRIGALLAEAHRAGWEEGRRSALSTDTDERD